jgi:hypothetical protein
MDSCADPLWLSPSPAIASFEESVQVAISPCCQRDLPDVILRIFPRMPGPIPRRSHRMHLPVSSPVSSAFPSRRWVGFPRCFREHDFLRPLFSRLQTFLYVQASDFAHPPGRSHHCPKLRQGGQGFYVRAERASLPPHAPDMLTARIQAIDGTGTYTSLDSQSYRLLPP